MYFFFKLPFRALQCHPFFLFLIRSRDGDNPTPFNPRQFYFNQSSASEYIYIYLLIYTYLGPSATRAIRDRSFHNSGIEHTGIFTSIFLFLKNLSNDNDPNVYTCTNRHIGIEPMGFVAMYDTTTYERK